MKTRDRIIEAVESDPGLHKSELCRMLEIGWGTVCHHLRVLESSRRVRTVKLGREVRIFPGALTADEAKWLAILREDVGVVDELRARPGARLKDLTERLDASRKVVRRHLTMLNDAGILQKSPEGRTQYSLREGLD